MPTPGNSVLDRATSNSNTSYLSRIVAENEDLKIQVEELNEKLAHSGLSQLYQLQEENESLTIQVSQLHVQLEERDNQIHILHNSDTRFENINNSLQELLAQIGAQRKELSELKFVVQEKEAVIANLQSEMKKKEEEVATAQQQALERGQQTQEQAERQQREAAQQSEQQLADAREALSRVEAQLHEKEQEVLALKEGAAQQSRLRCEREHATGAAAAEGQAALEAQLATAQAREVAAEKARLETQAALQEKTKAWEALQKECDASRQHIQKLVQEQQQLKQQLAQATAAAPRAAAFNGTAEEVKALFANNKEAKALLAQKVSEGCADKEARLAQQVNENAHLLSRMAILQEESENLVKKLKAAKQEAADAASNSQAADKSGAVDYSKETFTSGAPLAAAAQPLPQQQQQAPPPAAVSANLELNSLKERVDYKSKMVGKRSTIEKRIADFLSPLSHIAAANANSTGSDGANNAGLAMINMRDLELLLQELLNYQEDTENESSTRLLIKDMEMEDEAAKLFATIRRLENERNSLLKQLQKEAFRTFKTTPKKNDPIHNIDMYNNTSTAAAAYSNNDALVNSANTSGFELHSSATNSTSNVHPGLHSPPAVSTGGGGSGGAPYAAPPAPATGVTSPLPSPSATGGANYNNNNVNMNTYHGKPPQQQAQNLTAVPLYTDPQNLHAPSTAPPAPQQQQQQQQQPKKKINFDLGSNSPNAHNNNNNKNNHNVAYQEQPGQRKTYNEILNEQNRRNLGQPLQNSSGANKVSIPHCPQNKDLFVCCPACTYEQKYGNVKCELCNTELVFYH